MSLYIGMSIFKRKGVARFKLNASSGDRSETNAE
jgi:hypothetical protein